MISQSHKFSFLFSFFAAMATSGVFACSCVPRTVEEKFANASTVFVGRILSAQEIRGEQPRLSAVVGTFRVSETLKGNPERLSVVETGYGGGDCGVQLLVGETYVFFADAAGRVNICTGTAGYTAGYEPDDAALEKLRALAHRAAKP